MRVSAIAAEKKTRRAKLFSNILNGVGNGVINFKEVFMSKEHEGKERTTLWFSPGGIRRCDAAAKLDGCKSRSDFVERAVNFYAGFISAQNHTDFFATVISEMVSGTIAGTERRLARMDFKLAVELAKLSHILASQCDIDDETLRRLHIRCVDEVKRINGVVRFDDAVEYQHEE